MLVEIKQVVKEGKFSFIKCQLDRCEKIDRFRDPHFSTLDERTDLGNDHHWLSKE